MVSIIVAVYNAEKYLSRCLESILSQTFKDIEVILVDDGSQDGSGEMCNEYAQKDNRVKVIHQPNGGVSSARQTGIENAVGEYTIHADPDDWMEKDYIETLYTTAKENDADVVISDYWFDDSDKKNYYSQQYKGQHPKDILKEILCTYNVCPTLWSILIRRTCYSTNHISFEPKEIIHGEDTLFICRVLLHAVHVVFVKKAFYHYNTTNTNSITNNISWKNLLSMKLMIREFEKDFDNLEYMHFYKLKKAYLLHAFFAKKFSLLIDFPDIHEILIKEGQPFKYSLPQSSCLAMALKGHARLAYLLFRILFTIHKITKK